VKILVGLTYYRPHVSGLTIYVERLARALAARGHQITVLTSQYDPSLPRREERDGVHIIRVPVAFRVSKGVIMPTIGLEATRQVARHDVVHLHLPQLDAAGIALRGRLMGRPVVLTYHWDLRLPPTLVNRIANLVVEAANRSTAALAHRVVAYTRDFATHSPYLSRYLGKVEVILSPVEVAVADSEVAADLAALAEGRGARPVRGERGIRVPHGRGRGSRTLGPGLRAVATYRRSDFRSLVTPTTFLSPRRRR
jgi:glycosyltransferase involved in cell wall biosynthesis